MLTWAEKIAFMTKKGMSWKEVQEMDIGLEEEKKDPPKEEPKEPPKEEPKEPPKEEPTENEKKLLERLAELEAQLKDAQANNVHGNNETQNNVSLDEQLNDLFKDIRI